MVCVAGSYIITAAPESLRPARFTAGNAACSCATSIFATSRFGRAIKLAANFAARMRGRVNIEVSTALKKLQLVATMRHAAKGGRQGRAATGISRFAAEI